MFKLKNLPIVVLVLLLFFACKRQNLLTYTSVNTTNSIYFADSSGAVFYDTALVTFAYSEPTVQDTTFGINVYVTGGPATTDRVYSVAVNPASSAVAGQEFQLPDSCIFHANHVKDTLYVKFMRATVLQDSTFHLILDLKPNQYFQTNLPFLYDELGDTLSATSVNIGINDVLTAGPYWASVFQSYFGTFSVQKVKLMNQIVDMPLNFWVNLYNNNLTPEAIFYALSFTKYLTAQAAAGKTVYEADGVTPMAMGAGY